MLTRLKQIVVIMCASLPLGVSCEGIMAGQLEPQAPIRSIRTTIEISEREEFFEKLSEFAEKYAFAIRVAPNHPNGEYFIIQMWREDLKVIGRNPFEVEKYRISFYQNHAMPVPDHVVDALISDLRRMIGEHEVISN